MAINSVYGYGTSNRVTGLVSGMDTDSIVQSLLQADQYKIDKAYKSQTKSEWKVEGYNNVLKQVQEFREKYLSTLSSTNMWTSLGYNAFKVSLQSNKYLDVTATASAFTSNYTVKAAVAATSASITGNKYLSRSQAVGYAGLNQISTATSDTANAISGDTKLSDLVSLGEGEKVSFAINGETFVFDGDKTVDDVLKSVNAKSSKTNVKAALTDDGKITFENVKPGASAQIKFKEISGGLFAKKDDEVGALGISNNSVAKKNTISGTTTLGELDRDQKIFGDGDTIKFSINGAQFSFDKSATLDDVMNAVNSSSAGVTMSYDETADQFRIVSDDPTKKLQIRDIQGDFFNADVSIGMNENSAGIKTYDTIERAAQKMGMTDYLDDKGKFSFTVNGKTFSFDKSTSLNTMMSTVNADPDINVTMSYSEITDSFTFRSSSTGEGASVTIENANGGKAFGTVDADGNRVAGFFGIDFAEGQTSASASGTDASLTFVNADGSEETVRQSSNTFSLDGLNFSIKQSFTATDKDDEISFGVTQDTDSVVEKVKTFVNDYNKLVESLNNIIHERKYYGKYDVLSESEREALSDKSEKDLEKYDAEAKKGILRNDSYISGLLDDLRSQLFHQVGSTGLSPADIGLATGTWDKYGQISLDEDKLRSALEKNANVVAEVMAGTTDNNSYDGNGMTTRLYNSLYNFEKTMKYTVIKNAEQEVTNYKDRYDDLMEKLYEKQERYYNQYAKLESLLSQYQSQSSWLTQQLGGAS